MGDISRIEIKGKYVGIVGLHAVLEEVAKKCSGLSEEQIGRELLSGVGRHNYIPRRAEGDYMKALLREFKRYIGEKVEEESPKGLRIVILGPGCARCDYLEQETRGALAELGLPADLEHISDPRAILKYKVMGTPALIINDRVVSVGKVLGKEEIKRFIGEVLSDASQEGG
ncbi:MAG: thioredoxin family protein [Syntrophales bacterium]|nr:thioredoxin family protein [Syntrophales bacterium]